MNIMPSFLPASMHIFRLLVESKSKSKTVSALSVDSHSQSYSVTATHCVTVRDSLSLSLPLLKIGKSIGVNISERKSGTERTKKRKKRELVFFTAWTAGVATGAVVHRLDATQILPVATGKTHNI